MALSVTLRTSVWPARMAALLLSAAAAASVVYWVLKLSAPASSPAVVAVQAPEVALDTSLVARALGGSGVGVTPAAGAPVAVAESARFVLVGVVDQRAGGAALIGVDGKAAKPVAVGATVADGWTLRTVQGRSATLERNGAQLLLELPPRIKG